MASDDSDNEGDDYALFGTALDPIDDEDLPRKRPVPIEEQVVTDEQGRRRFHGAFTGGFSAGYFNTVGSKEGWKPKEFVSKRSQKETSGKFSQRPEDFMDEEDMSAFGFAPQVLRASAKFQKDPEKPEKEDRKRKLQSQEPLLAHALINNILQPARETIGVKLLSEMGWKPGQGIGPKLTRNQKDRIEKSHRRLFGPTLPTSSRSRPDDNDSVAENDEDEFSQKYRDFLFAPDDLPSFVLSPKENVFGIGYRGLDRNSVLGNRSTSGHINLFEMPSSSASFGKPGKSDPKNRKGLKISGQAFGIGAYEEEDEDIYGKDDMSNYDFSLTAEKEESYKNEGRKKQGSRWSVTEANKTDDVIVGFELDARDEASSSLKAFFPPPEIPKDWQPKFLRLKPSRFEQEKTMAKNLTPSERRTMVETEPAKPSEVQPPTKSDEQLEKLLSANMETPSSSTSSASFKPFSSNPEKQIRYEKYLICVKNNRGDALHLLQPKSMTEWEKDREKVEFERASLLYKPLNTSMSSRFVSAGTSQDADGLEKSSEPKTNDSIKAAKLKMFGRLTREKIEWHPAKLLCIRFNVKHPYSDYSVIGVPTSHKSKFDIFGQLENPQAAKDKEDSSIFEESSTSDKPNNPEPMELKEGGGVTVENSESKNDEDEIVKPPIDLFKSIFLDSESESEAEEDKPKPEIKSTKTAEKEQVDPETSVLRKPIAAKGLFAKVDFDRLNQRGNTNNTNSESENAVKKPVDQQRQQKPIESKSGSSVAASRSAKDQSVDESSYGPAKPASVPVVTSVTLESETDSSVEEDWREKKSDKSSSKKKKKKDKKKKSKKTKKSDKHKKEKKKKKKKKRDNDASTETDNSDD